MRDRLRVAPRPTSLAALLLTAVPFSAGLFAARPAGAALELTAPLGEGMVIQREVPVPIRGTADPGAEVTVTFDGERLVGTADSEGRWTVVVAPRTAGGPYAMTVATAAETLRLEDVAVGDVWLCSGQSNMEWTVVDSLGAADDMALPLEAGIRHFKVPRSWSTRPEATLAGGAWESAAPDTVGRFTAVGYYFARALRRHLDVPIGLVNSTWGGSRIEAWMAAPSLGLDDAAVDALLVQEGEYERQLLASFGERLGGLSDEDPGFDGERAAWADPDLDDSVWETIEVPAQWEAVGWEGMDGTAWYRTRFELSAEEAAAGIRLGLGTIDDSDIAWVNGREVGRTEQQWNKPRLYEVPPEALRPGANVLAVRVEDTGGGGGIYGDSALLFVEAGGHRAPLTGTWKFQPGVISLNLDDRKRELPVMVYNKMIHPLEPFPVRGVIWYQGESNTGHTDALAYREQFQTMIRDWRRAWGAPELPFLWAQIASWLPAHEEPTDSDWAVLRESQAAALALPATAQAVLIDAGDAVDIHPKDKRVVGERLALAARHVAYGDDLVDSGPVYRGQSTRPGALALEFDSVGSGLEARGTELRGFAVAGADRRFHWADAAIAGDGVVVSSPDVPEPVAARYAWADNPEGANLYNREGLPAAPFRTDDWEWTTTPGDDAAENR